MINSDDPRLTAYVLGELNETEHAEVAAAIAASPELQAEISLIEQSAAFFSYSLQSVDGVALTDEQRRAIHESSADTSVELGDHARNVKGGFWRRAIIASCDDRDRGIDSGHVSVAHGSTCTSCVTASCTDTSRRRLSDRRSAFGYRTH